MHEYSIVQALIEQCETYAVENDAKKIIKAVIKIGMFSGVEPHLLQIAFDTFKEKTVCDTCELVMNIQPLVITCHTCGAHYTLDRPHYLCQECNGDNIIIEDGEEMFLMSLEMEN